MASKPFLVLAALGLVALAAAPPAAGLAAPTTVKALETGCPAPRTFCFDPARIEVGGGDLPFILDNSEAQAPHNWCITVGQTTSCAPGPTPNDTAAPGTDNATVTVTITEPGEYTFWCNVPGHRTLGMEGKVVLLQSAGGTTPPPPAGDDGTPPPGSSGSGGQETSKPAPGFEALGALAIFGALAIALRRR